MSKLLGFTNFLKDRDFAKDDLAKFSEIIEPIQLADGDVGYRLKQLKPADRITQRCKVLVQYTWHCRDYVKKILAEQGEANPGEIVNKHIKASRDIQVISYLANEYKHAGIDASQRWGLDLEPRFDKPYVYGVMRSFPHRMKPTVIVRGDSFPEIEFVGRAGVGDEVVPFTDFTWVFSCRIVDKDGNSLGDAAGICEGTFQTWLTILHNAGVQTSASGVSPAGNESSSS